eukprot:scaffold40423_cov57-Phaeocystis_antarctica.AAC.3
MGGKCEVGPGEEEQLCASQATLEAARRQSSVTRLVGDVDRRVGVEQVRDANVVAVETGGVQRGLAFLVLPVDVVMHVNEEGLPPGIRRRARLEQAAQSR